LLLLVADPWPGRTAHAIEHAPGALVQGVAREITDVDGGAADPDFGGFEPVVVHCMSEVVGVNVGDCWELVL